MSTKRGLDKYLIKAYTSTSRAGGPGFLLSHKQNLSGDAGDDKLVFVAWEISLSRSGVVVVVGVAVVIKRRDAASGG